MRPGPDVERALATTRRLLRQRGYRNRTIEVYARWLRRFTDAHPGVPVEDLTRRHVEQFLSVLTDERRLAPKSRNQAASALSFFFREVLGRDVLEGMPRAREPQRIPTVLSHGQVRLVLGHLSGKYRLLGSLMYGTGARLTECHQLRIKDIDFDLLQIAIRDGCQGPVGHAARAARFGTTPPGVSCKGTAPGGQAPRRRLGSTAGCTGSQGSTSGLRPGVAVPIPREPMVAGSRY